MAGVSGEVLVERDGPILAMTLNRPEVRNAVNHATAEAMARALDLLDGDDQISAGIVTGAGGTFCSGIDLKAFVRGERPEIAGRGFAAITQTPPSKPIIAAVEGFALAGGCELVLACDLVVAASSASFGLPEVKRVWSPAPGAWCVSRARSRRRSPWSTRSPASSSARQRPTDGGW